MLGIAWDQRIADSVSAIIACKDSEVLHSMTSRYSSHRRAQAGRHRASWPTLSVYIGVLRRKSFRIERSVGRTSAMASKRPLTDTASASCCAEVAPHMMGRRGSCIRRISGACDKAADCAYGGPPRQYSTTPPLPIHRINSGIYRKIIAAMQVSRSL